MSNDPHGGIPAVRTISTQCMNWEAYGLRQIWQMLEAEDGRISRNQVHAWRLMTSVCAHQADRLRQAMADLESVWPPDRSRAATEYRAVVLTMAQSLDNSAAAAHTNATVLNRLTDGISATKARIAKLIDRLRAYEAEHEQFQRSHPLTPDSGLLSQRRSQLDQEARQVMRAADVIPAAAHADFRVPEPYQGIPGNSILEIRNPPVMTSRGPSVNGPAPMAFSSHISGISSGPPPVELASDGTDGPSLASAATNPPPAKLSLDIGGLGETNIGPIGSAVFGEGRTGGSNTMIGSSGIIGLPTTATRASLPSTTHQRLSGERAMIPPTIPGTPSARSADISPSPGTGRAGRRVGRSNASNEWSVPYGHPQTIVPAAEPEHHDPGSGVIGIDR